MCDMNVTLSKMIITTTRRMGKLHRTTSSTNKKILQNWFHFKARDAH